MLIGSEIFPFLIVYFCAFDQLMNFSHMLLYFPNLLEFFSTELAGELLFVNLPFLAVVNMFYMSCDIVTVEEPFSTDFTPVVTFAGM